MLFFLVSSQVLLCSSLQSSAWSTYALLSSLQPGLIMLFFPVFSQVLLCSSLVFRQVLLCSTFQSSAKFYYALLFSVQQGLTVLCSSLFSLQVGLIMLFFQASSKAVLWFRIRICSYPKVLAGSGIIR